MKSYHHSFYITIIAIIKHHELVHLVRYIYIDTVYNVYNTLIFIFIYS